MGSFPIKVLIDEDRNEFVPWVAADCIYTNDGLDFEEKFATKMDASNLKEGTGIIIEKDGADCTFSVDFGATDNIIDNLDTTVAGQGPLDARQGNVLKNMIPQIVDNLETADATKVLSANQGYELSKRALPTGGNPGQVLKRADDGESLEWGDAADPNAIGGDGSIMSIVELTYAEYKTLESNGQLQEDTEYHISDVTLPTGVEIKATYVEMEDGTNVEENIIALQKDIEECKKATGADISAAFDARVTEVETAVSDINNNISNIETTITSINSDITSMGESISSMESALSTKDIIDEGQNTRLDIAEENIDNVVNMVNIHASQLNNLSIASGNWYPDLAVVGQSTKPTWTIETRRGNYYRIGKLVYVDFYIRGNITALPASTNYAVITGLPYTQCNNAYFGQQALSVGTIYNALYSSDRLVFVVYGNSIRIQGGDGQFAVEYCTTPAGGYFELAGSGTYIID